jgi:hypothetical protein
LSDEFKRAVYAVVAYDPDTKQFSVVPKEEMKVLDDRVWSNTAGWQDDGHEEQILDVEHLLTFELEWNAKAHEFLRLYYRGTRNDADDKRFEILRAELDTVL